MAASGLLAVVMRPVGGRLSDQVPPTRTLTGALAALVAAASVQVLTPALGPVGTIALLSVTGCRSRCRSACLRRRQYTFWPPDAGRTK